MRRPGVAALLVVSGATLVALFITASVDKRELAFTLGVQPAQVVAVLAPGKEACQRPVDVSADASLVRFPVRTSGATEPALRVIVRDLSEPGYSPAAVGDGHVDASTITAPIPVREGQRLEVCVRDEGQGRIGLLGGPAQAARTSALYVEGRPANADMALVFEREDSRSMLALLPDALERATLFTAGWVSPALLWTLGAAFLFGVPLLLSLALRASAR